MRKPPKLLLLLGAASHSYITRPTSSGFPSLFRLSPNRDFNPPADCGCAQNYRCCSNAKTCIPLSKFCDAHNDCGDNSDEQTQHCACTNWDSFVCNDGKCIDKALRCNNSPDCLEGEDELDCETEVTCAAGELKCHKNNHCIDNENWCNGKADCPDGEDESDCGAHGLDKFRCLDGSLIPREKFCDGKNDCSNGKTGEDEHALGCHSATCDGFQCDNGVCLHHTMTCDNEDDCGDGSDESVATCAGRNVTCSDSQFQCRSNKYCISKSKLCNSYKDGDYYADCVDGSDEDATFCASDEFECAGEQRPYKCKGAKEAPFCVPQAWVNDGMEDCANGFDEPLSCLSNEFRCTGESVCLPYNKVCDGVDDCFDGTDEGGHCDVTCDAGMQNCDTQCIQTPRGTICQCKNGFMHNDALSCVDVNECAVNNGGCAQRCENSEGSFQCSCHDDFYLNISTHECNYKSHQDISIEDFFVIVELRDKTMKNPYRVYHQERQKFSYGVAFGNPLGGEEFYVSERPIVNYHYNDFTNEAWVVEEDRIFYLNQADNPSASEQVMVRKNNFIDDSVVDWAQGRLYLSTMHLPTQEQMFEVVDIVHRNQSGQFPTAVLYEFEAPRYEIPITFIPKPNARTKTSTYHFHFDENNSKEKPTEVYRKRLEDSFVFYGDGKAVKGLKMVSPGEWTPYTICEVDPAWEVTEITTDWYDTDDLYVYFIMTNYFDGKKAIGACGLSLDYESGFLDRTHMEEIQRVTNYIDPVGLSFTMDSLYWFERGRQHGDSNKTMVTAEAFNVRNKQMRKLLLPLTSDATPFRRQEFEAGSVKVNRLIATSIARDPFDENLATCRNSEMESDGQACSSGVCISEKCFCPKGLFRVTEGTTPSTQNCATENNPENQDDAGSIGLYGVDVNGDVYYVVYDNNHKQIGEAEPFGSRLPMKLGFITAIRYDFYDRSLIINDRFEGIARIRWSNAGPVPKSNIQMETIHKGGLFNFFGERTHALDDLFDYDAETGTVCWGQTVSCTVNCNRNGNTFTIWDEDFSFRRGNHQMTFGMSAFNHVRCPNRIALAPGGLLYIVAKSQFTYGSLDKDYSMVVVFSDNVWKHKWDPSYIDDFVESDQFLPEYILFMDSTRRPHKLDENFAILEMSQKTKRVRIGIGNEATGTLSNTIKFSISQGQKVLDVRTAPGQIWIQADNARMTILTPNHKAQTISWDQTYTTRNQTSPFNVTFHTFDVFMISNSTTEETYPCRSDRCDQLCRDETQHIFEGEKKTEGPIGNYICSCSRDYIQDAHYPEYCHQMATCHHKKLMCDYEPSVNNQPSVSSYRCIGRDKLCDGTSQCADAFDESEKICSFLEKHSCKEGEFSCPTERRCLAQENICDGKHDCDIGNSFSNTSAWTIWNLSHSDEDRHFCIQFDCPQGSKKCGNGYQCLLDEFWNDGIVQCEVSEDDEQLSSCSSSAGFACDNGRCIDDSWRCDGDNDCAGGEDEKNCTKCSGTAFFCGNDEPSSRQCFRVQDVCDGIADCASGADEHDDCGADFNQLHARFPNHRHESINITAGMEYQLRGASLFCDNSKEFHCRNNWKSFGSGVTCLPFEQVCDGKIECPYSDDELSYPKAKSGMSGDDRLYEHSDDLCATSCDPSALETKRREGTWNCDSTCIPTPTGPMCACPQGTYWDGAAQQCHDVDECERHDRCQQKCTNYFGGFECECANGYVKEGEGLCRAKTPTTVITLFEDRIEWMVLNTSNVIGQSSNGTVRTLFAQQVRSVMSIAADPVKKDIFILSKDGQLVRCPMDYPDSALVQLDQYRAVKAKKIAYDTFGEQLYILEENKISVMSRDGQTTRILARLQVNDFALVPEMGLIVCVSDHAVATINMDGTNKLTLFTTEQVRLTSVAVDFPTRRIFYTATGMPANVTRVLSSKFDGSDKFRHYTIVPRDLVNVGIRIFENRLYLTDGSRQSAIYFGQKFPTNDKIDFVTTLSKDAINIEFSNAIIGISPIAAPKSRTRGVLRFLRNEALNVEQLLAEIKTDVVKVEVAYRCAGDPAQVYRTEPDCSSTECALPPLVPDSHKSISRSGKSLTVTCNDGFHIARIKKNSTTVVCEANGEWSDTFQCVQIECPPLGFSLTPSFESPNLMKRNIFDFTHILVPIPGSVAVIACMWGSFYKGQDFVAIECQDNGSWNLTNLEKFRCNQPLCPDLRQLSSDELGEGEVGVTVDIKGFDHMDITNISCKSDGYIVNSDADEVQVQCADDGRWYGTWGYSFDNNTTGGEMHTLNATSALPKCFKSAPAFMSVSACRRGCEVGSCYADKNATQNVFKCECGEGHGGFHCLPLSSGYSTNHVAAITVPLLLLLVGLCLYIFHRRRYEISPTALINEHAPDSFEDKVNQAKLPWESDVQNSKFPSIHKKTEDHSKTSFRPGFLRRYNLDDQAPLINPIFEAESAEFPSDDFTHEKTSTVNAHDVNNHPL